MQSHSRAIIGGYFQRERTPTLREIENPTRTFKVGVNEFSLEKNKKSLEHNGVLISLTGVQYEILESIVTSDKFFASHNKLESLISGECRKGSIKVHIHRIRKKLNDGGFPISIKVVQGEGFILTSIH